MQPTLPLLFPTRLLQPVPSSASHPDHSGGGTRGTVAVRVDGGRTGREESDQRLQKRREGGGSGGGSNYNTRAASGVIVEVQLPSRPETPLRLQGGILTGPGGGSPCERGAIPEGGEAMRALATSGPNASWWALANASACPGRTTSASGRPFPRAEARGCLARPALLRRTDAAWPDRELSCHLGHLPPEADAHGDQLPHW